MNEREDFSKKHLDELQRTDRELFDKLINEFGLEKLKLLARFVLERLLSSGMPGPVAPGPSGRDLSINPSYAGNLANDLMITAQLQFPFKGMVIMIPEVDQINLTLYNLTLGTHNTTPVQARLVPGRKQWSTVLDLTPSTDYALQAQVVDQSLQSTVYVTVRNFFATA